MNAGDRIRLVYCSDQHTHLTPGDQGTVRLVDALGTVHVAWDSGSSLGLVEDAGDRFERVDRDEEGER